MQDRKISDTFVSYNHQNLLADTPDQ